MDIAKFFLAFIGFIIGRNKFFSNKIIMSFAVNGLFIAILINQLTKNNAVLAVSTGLNITGISLICGLIFSRANTNLRGSRYNWKSAYFYYVLFILMVIVHNLFDSFGHLTKGMESALAVANPWGLMLSFIFVFSFNSNADINFTDSRSFIRTIYIASFILFFIVGAVSLGIIKTDTAASKVFEGTGGVGLLTTSTNETALMAICFIIYLVRYGEKHLSNFILILCVILDLIVIILTRSRIGIFSIAFIMAIFIFTWFRKKPMAAIGLSFLIAMGILPFWQLIMKIISKRFQSDTSFNIGIVTIFDKFGISLSGRTLIWDGYLTEFLSSLAHNPFFLYVGSGYDSMLAMYNNSFLPLTDYKMDKVNFFPLHSDMLLIFIVTGFLGLLIWWIEFTAVMKFFIKNPSFIKASFMWVLFIFTMIDMLNYSLLSSLLIGLGISNTKT